MELMADEMADFKIALLQLQVLSSKLEHLSIPISTEILDKNLKDFLEKQQVTNFLKDQIVKDIQRQMKRDWIIPKYILIGFGGFLILLMAFLAYFIRENKVLMDEKVEIYHSISESEIHSYRVFFSENEELKESYCNWLDQTR